MISKRSFLVSAGATGLLVAAQATAADPAPLKSLSEGAQPISAAERNGRIAKLQGLMRARGIAAFVVESGSTLDYFTGIQWWRSERVTACVIPAAGQPVVVTPAFEAPSVRETLQVEAEVRIWNEDESPLARIVQAIKDRKVKGSKAKTVKVAVEPTTRFFIVDGLRRLARTWDFVSGEALVNGCRQIKSPTELALMQVASDITIAALRHTHGQIQPGMTSADIATVMNKATAALGGEPEFALVLLNEASAYPHGSHQAQAVREGSTILMDCGCTVHGYQSDISRTFVYGAPSAKQRKVWETVRRGQDVALETAKEGVPVGRIDDAVRAYYEKEGWGPGYRLPGLSHRTGHGIGLDGHESPYLVHNDASLLKVGMCFSDEPGLYIPGEFGIRLEDCWTLTPGGPKLFTPLAVSIDQPV